MSALSKSVAFLFAGVVGISSTANATDFYVDPVNGAAENDGSIGSPWRTFQQVIEDGLIETQAWNALPYADGATLVAKNAGAPVQAGDTIWLLSGFHGDIVIDGMHNSSDVNVWAPEGETPQFGGLLIRSGSRFHFRGIHISPSFNAQYDTGQIVALVSHAFQGPSFDLTLEDCEVFSVDDIGPWTDVDWNTLAANGIDIDAPGSVIRGNMIRNVNFGITVPGASVLVTRNTVQNFAGDGLRGLGDNSVFSFNLIKNCYNVNENHDDGFQSWSRGPTGVGTGEVVGVVLNGNTILNYEDANQPYRCQLQGIGMFDGSFRDWVIENNVIIVDHWHGITLLGAYNTRISNNTLVDINGVDPGPPWIQIGAHKNTTPSAGNTIANNLTTDIEPDVQTGVNIVGNIIYSDVNAHFVAAASGDYSLKSTSTAVDNALAPHAPGADANDAARPIGLGYDVGAYEAGSVAPSPDPTPEGDAGPSEDAGVTPSDDAGTTTGDDAGTTTPDDAGTTPGDDAGTAPDDAGTTPTPDPTPEPDPTCAVGSEGCACTQGGACDGTLSCLSELCVDADEVTPACTCSTPSSTDRPLWLLGVVPLGILALRRRRREGAR